MARLSKAHAWMTDTGLALLRYWKQCGLTDPEIAKKMKIGVSTLSDWKKRHSEIAEALKNGEEAAIAEAVSALQSKFKKTELTETRTEEFYDSNGEPHTKTTTTIKEVAPDTAAIIFYLKAKAGWRDNSIVTDRSAIDKLDQILKQTQDSAEMEEDEDE